MTRRSPVLAAMIVAVALLASCSSSGSDAQDDSDGDEPDAAPEAEADEATPPVRVATLNLLHGFFCPPETDACQAPDRVQIFTELVEDADCPELIGLQEIGPRLEEVLLPAVAGVCGGGYDVAWEGVDSPDRSLVITTLPIVDRGYLDIANFPWDAYWVRVDSGQGAIDFLTAHFASSSNNPPCAPDRCPPACPPGTVTNECHAIEVADFFAQRPARAALSVVAGDLNATPSSPTVATLLDAGFVDGWLEAGHAECDPATHVGCTGGGSDDEPFVGMDTPAGPGFDERIDYLLVRPEDGCTLEVDTDSLAATPRAEPLNGLWWPSDHAGLLADLRCDGSG
jgi:Endonuclease/Exonuclease/phosphatase family